MLDAGYDDIRAVLREYGRLACPVEDLGADDDLFALGLDSAAVVHVMLALEERYGMEIPERLLTRHAFSSLTNLHQLITGACADKAA